MNFLLFLLESNRVLGVTFDDLNGQAKHIPDSLTRLMTTPNVAFKNGQWMIERDLFMYPSWAYSIYQTPAQLVRSSERISEAGTYTFKIGKVLAKGDEIRVLLPYGE